MIFYSDKNVYEAAKERIHYFYDEFPDRPIIVCFSGGKDSTTILHLTHEVAQERGINKVPVFFLDQEVEAPQTIDYMREVMNFDWVEPYWVQSYYVKPNGSSGKDFKVWGPGEKWVRDKEPNNPYADIKIKGGPNPKNEYVAFINEIFGPKNIGLAGVRIQESLTRRAGLLNCKVYKDITYGCKNGTTGNSYTFYPIYDWGLHDVWYYIFSNRFHYNKIYNYYFSKKPLQQCRVGAFIHPRCVDSIMDLKDISPEFYKRAMKRVENMNVTVQTHDMIHEFIGKLPPYFKDWNEYVYYIADNLIMDEKIIAKVKKMWDYNVKRCTERCQGWEEGIRHCEEHLGQYAISSIVDGSYDLVQMSQAVSRLIRYIGKNEQSIRSANKG